MKIKRILLMYISKVSGHKQAAIAIEKALKIVEPQVEILNINAFGYTNPVSEKIIDRIYMWVLQKFPKIWEYLYDNPKIIQKTKKIKEKINLHNSKKIKKLLDEFKPDAIVCTQAFPCGIAAECKKNYNLNIPLFGIVTDFFPHSYWIYPEVNFYVVASNEAREKLINKSVSEEKIKLLGIPIDPRFNKIENREKIAKELDLDLQKPTILVMGGGQGFGPIKDIIASFKKSKLDLQLIVVTGTNKKLYCWLKKYVKNYPKKIIILGFVDNIYELMSVSNLVITKPGGLTTAEALVKKIPMVIVKPIPGQEENNTGYLLKNHIGLRIDNLDMLNSTIENLFINKENLNNMRQNCLKIEHPNSSIEIAKLILSAC